jgi:hypothetical protein
MGNTLAIRMAQKAFWRLDYQRINSNEPPSEGEAELDFVDRARILPAKTRPAHLESGRVLRAGIARRDALFLPRFNLGFAPADGFVTQGHRLWKCAGSHTGINRATLETRREFDIGQPQESFDHKSFSANDVG